MPSCCDDKEKVALVECRGGLPTFLSELTAESLGESQMEMGDTDINFDQPFFGFTQLYTSGSRRRLTHPSLQSTYPSASTAPLDSCEKQR